jgi:hypothetical protein
MNIEKYIRNNVIKCILLILWAQVRGKGSNDMKLHMKWSVNFKKGRLKLYVDNEW